jgi:hypothetical protein
MLLRACDPSALRIGKSGPLTFRGVGPPTMNPDMPAPPSVPMFIEARLMQVQCQGERRRQGHEQRRHGIGTCSGSDLDLAISVGGSAVASPGCHRRRRRRRQSRAVCNRDRRRSRLRVHRRRHPGLPRQATVWARRLTVVAGRLVLHVRGHRRATWCCRRSGSTSRHHATL